MTMFTVGWLKDALAAGAFLFLISVFIFVDRLPRWVIMSCLGIALFVDVSFTAIPAWHQAQIGPNVPTLLVSAAATLAIACFAIAPCWITQRR